MDSFLLLIDTIFNLFKLNLMNPTNEEGDACAKVQALALIGYSQYSNINKVGGQCLSHFLALDQFLKDHKFLDIINMGVSLLTNI